MPILLGAAAPVAVLKRFCTEPSIARRTRPEATGEAGTASKTARLISADKFCGYAVDMVGFGPGRVAVSILSHWSNSTGLNDAAAPRESVNLWRLIASIGLGVELVNVDAYVSELVPKEQRGQAFAYNQFVMFTAVPVVAFLAWQLVPQTILGLDGWRWVVIIGSIGAFVIWWIRRNLPESPRWLEQHGRTAEAEKIVADLESRIRADGVELKPPEFVAGEMERKTGTWAEMWNATYRGRTIMLVIYNLFQTIGYYGFRAGCRRC